MLSIIVHDLKNPANSIIGYSKLVHDRIIEKDFDGIENYSEEIYQAAIQSLQLLDNLLSWSILESGKINFLPEKVAMDKILDKVYSLYEINIKQKELRYKQNYPENIMVSIDPILFETIIRNLLSNAIKFTPVNGNIWVNGNTDTLGITITIKDNGVGIDEQSQKILFNHDFNTHQQGTNGECGTGLGLHLCREFVELHHGSISVSSKKNKGTIFTIIIPQ